MRRMRGDEIFPMRTVYIINEEGETVKEYGETGIYVTDAVVEDRLLTMTARAQIRRRLGGSVGGSHY